MSKLGDLTITKLELSIPRFGSWHADCVLSGEAAPTGPATLTVGDLTLVGTIIRSGLDSAGKPHAVVIGGAGWEKPLTAPLSYQADSSVRLKTVLTDLTARAGEPMEQPADRALDRNFTAIASTPRAPVRLRDVLTAMHRAGFVDRWRIDPDGVLRFGARVGTAPTGRVTVISRNFARSKLTIGIDDPAQFLPGAIVEGATVLQLVVHETSGKLQAEVFLASDPLRTSILRMVASAFPSLVYGHPRTYVVRSVGDGLLDLDPAPDAPHLAPLKGVEQWAVATMEPQEGTEVIVGFRDANPARPFVVGARGGPGEESNSPTPVAEPTGRVVRWGDIGTGATAGSPMPLVPHATNLAISRVRG